MSGKSPLVYLREQLGFPLGEFQKLSQEDKSWYRAAAIEEMNVLGIEVAEKLA